MTEFWVSRKQHWCDVCKCWLNDSKQAIAFHEQGMGHKANLAKKLRDMSRKADQEKKEAESAAKAIDRIDKQAAEKFKRDQEEAARQAAAAKEAEEARSGVWEWDEGSQYYYNPVHRWYYDPKTKWYYGGEPTPEWKEIAPIPTYALFGTARHTGGSVPQPQPQAAAGSSAGPAAAVAAGVAKPQQKKIVMELPKHPQALIGGHQAPTDIGRVGAAKGVGSMTGKPATAAPAAAKSGAGAAGAAGDKRKREEKELSAAELEQRAKREAARQRVAQRTAQNFGFL